MHPRHYIDASGELRSLAAGLNWRTVQLDANVSIEEKVNGKLVMLWGTVRIFYRLGMRVQFLR